MSVLDALARRLARARLARLRALATAPREPQREVLRRLMSRAANTEYGRRHGLAKVRDLEDLAVAVPLRTYADWADDWQRARDGARDVSWPGFIRNWAITSGTTSGEKLMPVSDSTIRSNRGGGFDSIVPYLAQGPRGLLDGKLLFLGGSIALRREGRVLIGDNTGIMARQVPALLRRRHAPSPRIRALGNWSQKIELAVAETADQDVRMMAGVPSWLVLFAEQMLAHVRATGHIVESMRDVWPQLRLFVHGGVAFEPYAERVRALFGEELWCTDTYSASEGGMLAVQDRRSEPGMLPIVDRGTVFEFIPVRELESAIPTRLPIDRVEPGVDYAIVLHTDSGIFGYVLGDVVRFLSKSPLRLVFAGRTAHQLNAFGEHVSSGELDAAILHAARVTGSQVVEYTAAPEYPDAAHPEGRHVFFVEFVRTPEDLISFAAALDRHIAAGNEDYTTHRSFGLRSPIVIPVPQGAFLAWMARRGKLGGQNKVPRVISPQLRADLMEFVPATR